MNDLCGAAHPTLPGVSCSVRGSDHAEHTGWNGRVVGWPNEDHVAPLLREDRASRQALRRIAVEAGRRLGTPRSTRGV